MEEVKQLIAVVTFYKMWAFEWSQFCDCSTWTGFCRSAWPFFICVIQTIVSSILWYLSVNWFWNWAIIPCITGLRTATFSSISCFETFHHARYRFYPCIDLSFNFRANIWHWSVAGEQFFPPTFCALCDWIFVPKNRRKDRDVVSHERMKEWNNQKLHLENKGH